MPSKKRFFCIATVANRVPGIQKHVRHIFQVDCPGCGRTHYFRGTQGMFDPAQSKTAPCGAELIIRSVMGSPPGR